MRALTISLLVLLFGFSCAGNAAPVRRIKITPHPSLFVEIIKIPEEIVIGKELEISIKTDRENSCWVVFGYNDSDAEWTFYEMEPIDAEQDGICSWNWKVPQTVIPGPVEIRLGVYSKEGSRHIVPITICAKECQDCVKKCPRPIP